MEQHYRICVRGHFDLTWADRFERLSIFHAENGNTILTGPIIDQSGLYGVLNQLSDLGLALISLGPVEESPKAPIVNGHTQCSDPLIK